MPDETPSPEPQAPPDKPEPEAPSTIVDMAPIVCAVCSQVRQLVNGVMQYGFVILSTCECGDTRRESDYYEGSHTPTRLMSNEPVDMNALAEARTQVAADAMPDPMPSWAVSTQ